MNLILVLHNIRSTYNVGAILRTAEGFGVQRVILSGYTPRVHDARVLPYLQDKLDREIHKTALGAEEMLEIGAVDDILAELGALRKQGWQVVGLENNIERPLFRLGSREFRGALSQKVVLILGEEVEGISGLLYEAIDLFVEIPMQGQKESFNVSVAAGIAMYELTKSPAVGV